MWQETTLVGLMFGWESMICSANEEIYVYTGASSGFQPNQGKNTKFLAVVKIISYKRCLKTISVYFTQALQKSFHALDIFLQTLLLILLSSFEFQLFH